MREVHCAKPEHANKTIQIFYTPVKEHSGTQQFLCPYCREVEQWSGVRGEISRILINGPQWEEYHLFQSDAFVSPDELKTEALSRRFTKIKRDEENAREVALKDWHGFSSHVSGALYATVTYYLEGNRVRVRKALDSEDHWYTLS
jgi:hypothetical protein